MFLISRGRVHIFTQKGGSETPIAVRMPGDYVGENSLLSAVTAQATCVTADWCTLFLLRRTEFDTLCMRFPELRERVVSHVLGQMRDAKSTQRRQRPERTLFSSLVLGAYAVQRAATTRARRRDVAREGGADWEDNVAARASTSRQKQKGVRSPPPRASRLPPPESGGSSKLPPRPRPSVQI